MPRPALELPTFDGAPLLVTSPVPRCGTTLLQRLFNSGENGLVFGEGVFAGLRELARSCAREIEEHLARREEYRRDLERALAGEQFWCPHLMPEIDGYLALGRSALERFLRFHADAARARGRTIWGAKHPTLAADDLRTLRALLPQAKLVIVARDVFAAARSARARRFVQDRADLERFAVTWAANLLGARAALAGDPHVLFLRYEELDASALPALEAFTGVRGLRPEVLQVRVNTWSGTKDGQALDQYVMPCELSDEERATIEHAAGEGLAAYDALDAPVR